MTKNSPDEPKGKQDLTRFLREWSALWGEETRAGANEPHPVPLAMLARLRKADFTGEATASLEPWRMAMSAWATAMGVLDRRPGEASPGESTAAPGSEAAAVAPEPRDDALERLARRVDELEARLARLETPRRRRG